MVWDHNKADLSKLKAVGAPFGGPIALIRDPRKLQAVDQNSIRPTIQIYTSSGVELSTIPWNEGKLVKMGWSDQERLVCILEDGIVLQYTVLGELVSRYSMELQVSAEGVIDALIFPSGLAVLTRQFHVFAMLDWDEPHSFRIPCELRSRPTAWAAVDPSLSASQQLELLVATESGTIFVLNPTKEPEDMLLSNGPFTRLSVSPSGKMLASFTASGDLWVTLIDFSRNLCDLEAHAKAPPEQIVWCGVDSVVLYWPEVILNVGPNGDWIKYPVEEPLHLIQEIDGVRIISQSQCEFLERVPPATEEIFSIGSTSPAALLYDASENFENRNPKADELVRQIKSQLREAVDTCIEAVSFEFRVDEQRKLLKAAAFGKSFLDFYNPDTFTDRCRTLRVLNAVRHPDVGLPLTMAQYRLLTPPLLIDRLINHRRHFLASRVCDYLKIKPDRVLIHWACCKVKTRQDDASIANAIVAKLSRVPGISYAEVASTAYRAQRVQLATLLLDHEPRAADQVPLLLSMHQEELALDKAILSGDTDLIHLVLLNIQRTRANKNEFFSIVLNKPVARDLFISYWKRQDANQLRELFRMTDRPRDLGMIEVFEANRQVNNQDIRPRLRSLEQASKLFQSAKDSQFHYKSIDEQMSLLLLQEELQNQYPKTRFVDLSLVDTIFQLLLLDDRARANVTKSQFNVSDKRYWWICLKAYARAEKWAEIERLSKEKKSPIGYEPFAQVLIDHKLPLEAAKYIALITDHQSRAEWFAKIGYSRHATLHFALTLFSSKWKEAGEAAFKAKNIDLLEQLVQQAAQSSRADAEFLTALRNKLAH